MKFCTGKFGNIVGQNLISVKTDKNGGRVNFKKCEYPRASLERKLLNIYRNTTKFVQKKVKHLLRKSYENATVAD